MGKDGQPKHACPDSAPAVGGAAGLLRGQHVLVRAQHQAFLEAQTEGLHQPQRRGSVPVVGFHLADHRVGLHALGAPGLVHRGGQAAAVQRGVVDAAGDGLQQARLADPAGEGAHEAEVGLDGACQARRSPLAGAAGTEQRGDGRISRCKIDFLQGKSYCLPVPAPSQTQSHLRHPLTALLGSAGHVRVLRALATDRVPHSAPQLAAAAGLTPQGTRGVLDVLARQSLVKVHGSGRTQLYELNSAHPLASSLAALFRDEQGRWDALMNSIRDVLDRHGAVSAAWLYGSVARGEDAPDSDVDIALVVRSQAVADQVREALMPLEDTEQIRISLTALTAKDLAALPDDDPWWVNVVREARVLKGAAPDQARRRLARAAA